MNRDPLLYNRIMFHVTHAQHAVNLRNAQPMQNIRHQFLKTQILHAGNVFRASEISVGAVATRDISFSGNPLKLQELLGMLDEFRPDFEIVEPRKASAE